MDILSKGPKPDNIESHNSLKLSFPNIRDLRSNFAGCESFLESNSPDIFALCETNLDDSTDSGNFFARGHLLLIWKYSITHKHGLAAYVKEGLPFTRDLSLDSPDVTLPILSYVLDRVYFTQYLASFFSIDQLLHRYARFLILFHLT